MGQDRAGALAAIAPLMARRDPATERVRAFVLAMVGDVAGARQVVEAAMPAARAQHGAVPAQIGADEPRPGGRGGPFRALPRRQRDQAGRRDARRRSRRARDPLPVTRSAPPAAPKRQAPEPGHDRPRRKERNAQVPFDSRAGDDRPPAREPRQSPSPQSLSPRRRRRRETPRIASARLRRQRRRRSSRQSGSRRTCPIGSQRPVAVTDVPAEPQPPPVELAATTSTPAVDRLSDIDKILESPDEPIVRIPAASSQDELAARSQSA